MVSNGSTISLTSSPKKNSEWNILNRLIFFVNWPPHLTFMCMRVRACMRTMYQNDFNLTSVAHPLFAEWVHGVDPPPQFVHATISFGPPASRFFSPYLPIWFHVLNCFIFVSFRLDGKRLHNKIQWINKQKVKKYIMQIKRVAIVSFTIYK